VFDICKKVGAVPLVHAENGDIIDFLSKKLIRGESLISLFACMLIVFLPQWE
jgi:hypothetical protein